MDRSWERNRFTIRKHRKPARQRPGSPWSVLMEGIFVCFLHSSSLRTAWHVVDTHVCVEGMDKHIWSLALSTGRAVGRSQPSLHSSLCPKAQTPETAPSPRFWNYNSQNSNRITCELGRTADFQVPLQTYRITTSGSGGGAPAICVLTNPQNLVHTQLWKPLFQTMKTWNPVAILRNYMYSQRDFWKVH